jgi:hypothetical protein
MALRDFPEWHQQDLNSSLDLLWNRRTNPWQLPLGPETPDP